MEGAANSSDAADPREGGDTIAALATARGQAALAVVRLSGPGALAVAQACFSNPALADAAGRTAHVGWVVDADGRRLDQAVALVFRAPQSATGEDTVEITTHGGEAAPQAVLRALYAAGARPAAPGEFTERAFLNGKLDLAQAEAVADLIHAQSRLGQRAALAGLEGHVGRAVDGVRAALVQTAALVELELDFADEDVEFASRDSLDALLVDADRLLGDLLSTARLGALARDGVRVVLGGRPNAGKSTLFNALVGSERAIVSATPGTTRDRVEADAEVGGLRVRFVDTAGLRATTDALADAIGIDPVEAEGARRAEAAMHGADALLYLADARTGPDAEERAFLHALAASRPDLPVLVVASRADLADTAAAPPWAALAVSGRDAVADPPLLDALLARLLAALRVDAVDPEASVVTVNERHRRHLADAQEAVWRARAGLAAGQGGDTLALDLRTALHALGLVTGAVTSEDVLSAVFSQFCIGK